METRQYTNGVESAVLRVYADGSAWLDRVGHDGEPYMGTPYGTAAEALEAMGQDGPWTERRMGKALRIEQVASRYGYPDAFVREACMRGAGHHPLPCIKRGGRRPQCYIQPATFERWLAEEERLQAGDGPADVLGAIEAMRACIEVPA